MDKKIRLGVIGAGIMGMGHIDNILSGACPEIQVSAVSDTNGERLSQIKERLPAVAMYTATDEMLDSGFIDAALIATHHFTHPELAIACMEHGIHVMVEKPAGTYTRQVREMNEAAAKSGVVFGIMFNQRTNHIFRKMKALVSGGSLGEIRRVSWIITDWYRSQAYYDAAAWRATWSGEGGGVLLNQCPHNLDLLQWICGLPIKVDAKLHFGKWHDIEAEDDVSAYMEFENGATGTFITSTGDTPGSNRFEITLDGGKLLAEDGQLRLWRLAESEPAFSARNKEIFAAPNFTESVVETDGESGQHIAVMNAFAGAILRNEPLIADGAEGIRSLMLSNAMHLSAFMGGPVSLPIDEELYYNELMKQVG